MASGLGTKSIRDGLDEENAHTPLRPRRCIQDPNAPPPLPIPPCTGPQTIPSFEVPCSLGILGFQFRVRALDKGMLRSVSEASYTGSSRFESQDSKIPLAAGSNATVMCSSPQDRPESLRAVWVHDVSERALGPANPTYDNHCVGLSVSLTLHLLQDPKLMNGLVPSQKSERVRAFQAKTVETAFELIGALGLESPADVRPHHILLRTSPTQLRTVDECYPILNVTPGSLLTGESGLNRLQSAFDEEIVQHGYVS